MNGIRYVSFDAMGTLIRPRMSIGATYQRIAKENGVKCDAEKASTSFSHHFHMMEKTSPCYGWSRNRSSSITARDWWYELVGQVVRDSNTHGRVPEETKLEIARDVFAYYNKGKAWQTVENLNGVKKLYFDNFYLSGEMGVAKPSVEFFKRMCDDLECEPRELVHVGDCPQRDYEGALDAGCNALLLDTKSAPIDGLVRDDVIQSLNDLLKILPK